MTKFIAPVSEASGFFLTAEEKDVIIANNIPLQVLSVEYTTDSYNGKVRQVYKVKLLVEGEERGWTFGVGTSDGAQTSRDRFLASLENHLSLADAEAVEVIVDRIGQFYTLEVAGE